MRRLQPEVLPNCILVSGHRSPGLGHSIVVLESALLPTLFTSALSVKKAFQFLIPIFLLQVNYTRYPMAYS